MRKLLAVLLALCLAIPCAFAEEDSACTWREGENGELCDYRLKNVRQQGA